MDRRSEWRGTGIEDPQGINDQQGIWMPQPEDTGKHGYIAPIFSFDVVLLELISFHEPVRYVQAKEVS